MIRSIFIITLFLSSNVNAEDLIAVLNLKFIKDTGNPATFICFDEAGEECEPYSTFYLYEAKIKKVLSGEFSSKKFKVIYGRHALVQKNLKNVVASLSKLEDYQEAEFQIIEWGEFREMYCFRGKYSQPYNISDVKRGQRLKCYEEE